MNPNEKYSRAVPVRVHHLPEVSFDMTTPKGDGPSPSRAVPVRVHHLPEVSFDMTAPPVTPAVALTFRLRADASPAAVGVDLASIWKVLTGYELSLREAREEQSTAGTLIRLVLTPTNAAGAADRLAKLVAAVNDAADPALPAALFTGRSFDRCEAALCV